MDNLFDREINLEDTIYVHVKGQAKEIEIEKTDSLLGLTLCDNKNGLCLIKKIKDGSVIDKIKFIHVSSRLSIRPTIDLTDSLCFPKQVGDVIERINNTNLLGRLTFEAASLFCKNDHPMNYHPRIIALFILSIFSGYRHIDVANMLKSIPVGELFVIRLIEPCRDSGK